MSVESEFVAAFVNKAKRDRWTAGLADARLRPKLLARLWNSGGDWDARRLTPLRLTGKRSEQTAAIVGELRRRGAGDNVHVLATNDDLDGRMMSLDEAVDHFSDDGGAVLLCGPHLALHFPETGDPLLLTG
jgi:hypothetical protein